MNRLEKHSMDMIGLVQALDEAAASVDAGNDKHILAAYIKAISKRFEKIARELK